MGGFGSVEIRIARNGYVVFPDRVPNEVITENYFVFETIDSALKWIRENLMIPLDRRGKEDL